MKTHSKKSTKKSTKSLKSAAKVPPVKPEKLYRDEAILLLEDIGYCLEGLVGLDNTDLEDLLNTQPIQKPRLPVFEVRC